MKSKPLKRVWAQPNLEKAWQAIQDNGRTSRSEDVRLELEVFAANGPAHLRSLKANLSRGKFRFPPAKGIKLPKKVEKGKTRDFRPIVLAPVESRIVQRALLNVLVEVEALKPFAETTYSFGGIRSARRPGLLKQPRAEMPSAVPAAIKSVLEAIRDGARYVACCDVEAFFTKVSKTNVLETISAAVQDAEFMDFLGRGIHVELANLSELRHHTARFPIEDMGVAQGSSLSPLLGNIALASFDEEMNSGDCRCIRYIDDFIILGPTEQATNYWLRRASKLLKKRGMSVAKGKTAEHCLPINKGFEFLGIEIVPGLIRPAKKAQRKFEGKLAEIVDEATANFRRARETGKISHSNGLIATFRRLDGTIDGWGKHYWFCNDVQTMRNLDDHVDEQIRKLLGSYGAATKGAAPGARAKILGVSRLSELSEDSFAYPASKL